MSEDKIDEVEYKIDEVEYKIYQMAVDARELSKEHLSARHKKGINEIINMLKQAAKE